LKQAVSGTINERISVANGPHYPGYVIRGDTKNLLIEAGINLLGPLLLKSVEEILGDRNRLDYLFVTHSHYDHLGSAGYLKRHIKNLSFGAHERIAALLQKESVLATMNRLSEIQRPLFQDVAGKEDLRMRPLDLDLRLKEGDTFDLGGLTCRVYEVPGHTRDSLAFFIPELGALFPGEAAGVPIGSDGEEPQVEFLASYDDYLASLEKLIALEPTTVCIGHAWVLTDADARGFLRRSRAATFVYRQLIESYLKETSFDIKKTVEVMTRKEYDEKGTIYQERNAYITNLEAQVALIAEMART
jgi:2-aminobenzoylacetyl-CoA thioesterase